MTCRSIAILEFISGGGLVSRPLHEIPSSLLREGKAMLLALATDWARLPDWNVVVCWDSRLAPCVIPDVTTRLIDQNDAYLDVWHSIAMEVDFVLVIAPEIDNKLFEIVETLREHGANLLNADSQFLNAASDKWLTAQSFHQAKIAHPKTFLLGDALDSSLFTDAELSLDQAWLIKPRDGAGCHRIQRFNSLQAVKQHVEHAFGQASDRNRYLLQPWIEGSAGSVAVLGGADKLCVLPAMRQTIELGDLTRKSDIHYSGGQGPWPEVVQSELDAFAIRTIQSLPGTPIGWIGVDFVMTDRSSPAGSFVAIEVNPRMTTSYLGLREIIDENLAQMLFQTATGIVSRYSLSGRSIGFNSFGTITKDEVY